MKYLSFAWQSLNLLCLWTLLCVILCFEFLASCVCSENDVAAIDVNMGCPKEFSIKVMILFVYCSHMNPTFPLLDNIPVMLIDWRSRGNIIKTALCWIV